MPELVTLDEAAAQLKCSKRHVSRMIKRGLLRTVDIGLGLRPMPRVYLELQAVTPSSRKTTKYKPQVLKG